MRGGHTQCLASGAGELAVVVAVLKQPWEAPKAAHPWMVWIQQTVKGVQPVVNVLKRAG